MAALHTRLTSPTFGQQQTDNIRKKASNVAVELARKNPQLSA